MYVMEVQAAHHVVKKTNKAAYLNKKFTQNNKGIGAKKC